MPTRCSGATPRSLAKGTFLIKIYCFEAAEMKVRYGADRRPAVQAGAAVRDRQVTGSPVVVHYPIDRADVEVHMLIEAGVEPVNESDCANVQRRLEMSRGNSCLF